MFPTGKSLPRYDSPSTFVPSAAEAPLMRRWIRRMTNTVPIISTMAIGRATQAIGTSPANTKDTKDTAATVSA